MKIRFLLPVMFVALLAFALVCFASNRADQIKQKVSLAQLTAKSWLSAGKDPGPALALMRLAGQSFDRGDADGGERLVDQALKILQSPPAPAKSVLPATGSKLYENAQAIEIVGYSQDAMEPCISLDGKYLFFNNSNEVADTHLYAARRIDDTHFQYIGTVKGTRFAPASDRPSMGEREMAPTVDLAGEFVYTAVHWYGITRRTLCLGHWSATANGGAVQVKSPQPIAGNLAPAAQTAIVPGQSFWLDMDCCISPDGQLMVISRALMTAKSGPSQSDLIMARRNADGSFDLLADSDKLLSNVNTAALEYAPAITADGLELYFTRADTLSPASMQTMVARRRSKSEPFGMPLPLAAISGFAEAPSLTLDKKELYFHKKVGERFCIYRVTRASR